MSTWESPTSTQRACMERLFGEHKIHPRVVMEMPGNETIKQAVMAAKRLSPAATVFKDFMMTETASLIRSWA